ncbi:unnamed protein product [Brassica napus]|uniref:Autophagy-related protein n=7 Tax=Brassica TaxID=3705 RepID=A0A816QE49_BRANA|nr:unnamed protein product [Brassica napus]
MKRTHSQPLETRNTQKGDAWTGHATNFTETAAGTSTGITPESRAFTGKRALLLRALSLRETWFISQDKPQTSTIDTDDGRRLSRLSRRLLRILREKKDRHPALTRTPRAKLVSTTTNVERQCSGGGNHLDGRQLLVPRSEVSGSIMSNRFSGNKRSNSNSQFTAQDHPETLHWSKMLRNGPGSLSMNMNHMANQPPRGGGGQISHLLHQLSSSRFKDENVVPSVISQTAADEGSRTGMKGPGVMSPFTMPNPSRFECFTPSRTQDRFVNITKRPHIVTQRLSEVKMNKGSSFKLDNDFEKRKAEAGRILEKYPDRIPVIVEKAEKSDIPDIDKKKYLVPSDLTVGQFVYVIRKRIKLSAEKAIFIFVDNVLPPTGEIMSSVYEEKKDQDGFLYITYSGENTFGASSI